MREKVLATLEYTKIIKMLTDKAVSTMGKERCGTLAPMTSLDEITRAQRETSEAVSMIIKRGSLPLGGIRDVHEAVRRAAIGGMLSMDELVDVGDFLYVVRKAKHFIEFDLSEKEREEENFPLLAPRFSALQTALALEKEITRCILSRTEMADDASAGLHETRNAIKIANARIKDALNAIIHSQSHKTMLQDAIITIRADRYCVPVKQEYRASFSGIVHDQSATGATLFIEPAAVVELNNKLKELAAREKAEIEKILMRLSSLTAENGDLILSNTEILTDLDFIFAKGELSLAMKGSEPLFNTRGAIHIKKGRHPLLNPETVVPTDIRLGESFTALLITGPNTGGKTVSLKTLGLFTLMGQAGLHIAAFDNSELAVFDGVFADIGDEQSIEQNLSTFSSHMKNIIKILAEVTDNSLVLLDELGAGTDPTEGAALAVAILQYLNSRGIRTAVTTHYSELKLYALATSGVENASCEFDVETLRPTYRLLIGIPGKSNAFAISQKLGLPDTIIAGAKEVVSHEDARFEDVITDLEISRKNVELERERAQQFRGEAEKLAGELEAQRAKFNEQRDKILLKAREEAREIIRAAKTAADELSREFNRKLAASSRKEMQAAREKLNERLSIAEAALEAQTLPKRVLRSIPEVLRRGDRVFVHTLSQSGVVETPPDAGGETLVRAGIMKIRVNKRDLSLEEVDGLVPSAAKRPEAGAVSHSVRADKSRSISPELDIRGCSVTEGLERAGKYIDDAYLASTGQVVIIHGKGTGALRSAVHDMLRRSPSVKDYRLGTFGEGESGVTIVELA
ncbi:MAG: endonuclease MutS2 [Clostridiales bacterium]|jgi:DNA mismatch repair protein MutS2|nr:endonuclease MutS2 [Clostridiales bacterium]